MASVYEKRGTWYANFKDATGRRRNVATKATTKTEARAWPSTWSARPSGPGSAWSRCRPTPP